MIFNDREIRVSRYLKTAEAIERQKQKDAAKNGRKKMKNPNKRMPAAKKEKKEKKAEKTEKKEKVEKVETSEKKAEKKKERKPRKEKSEKKQQIDLSFMGKKAVLSVNAVNAKRRILKKQKK